MSRVKILSSHMLLYTRSYDKEPNLNLSEYLYHIYSEVTWPHSTTCSVSDSRARGPRFNTQPGHLLLFLLLHIQEGPLSVPGESIGTLHWLCINTLKV